MASVTNFITVYENTLPASVCQKLIQKFEANPQCHRKEQKSTKNGDWSMLFTQINFAENEEFKKENEVLHQLFLQAIDAYKKEHNIQPHQWPKKFKLEPIRMKRYLPNSNEGFGEHVDVSNYATAKRFLVFFIYLNDNFEGGETSFVQFNVKIKAKQGGDSFVSIHLELVTSRPYRNRQPTKIYCRELYALYLGEIRLVLNVFMSMVFLVKSRVIKILPPPPSFLL